MMLRKNFFWYLLALLLPIATLLVREALPLSLGDRPLLILFMPAMLLVAFFGGWRAGLLATASTGLLTAAFLIPPAGKLWLASEHDLFQWTVLVLIGGATSFIGKHLIESRTKIQKSLDDLNHSERLYRQMTEALPQLVWTCRADGPCDYLSPQWIAYTGIAEAPQLGFGWLEQLHPDDRQRTIDHWIRTAGQGQLFEIDFRIRRHDGIYRWFHTLARPLRNDDGKIVKWFGSNTDIHDQKILQEELEKHHEHLEVLVLERTASLAKLSETEQAARTELEQNARFLRTITDAIPGMVGYWDKELRNRFANKAYVDWFGLTPEEIFGKHIAEILGPAVYQKNEPYIRAVLRGDPQLFERTLTKADGTPHHALAQYLPDICGGEVRGFYVLVSDVTQIEQAKRAAEAANQAKSAFLATMSHEIRTPLNAIVGISYLMSLSDLNEDQKSDLEIISSSSKNLLSLVNDVLDFSKIEAGELKIETRPFSLASTLQDLQIQFASLASEKHLTLSFAALPETLPPVLLGDSNRLKQVLINLLNNAIKFTAAGTVSLAVRLAPSSTAGLPRLNFQVSDTGIGISAEAQTWLFQPFKQANASTTRQYGGTGLGLSIVKRLVELMGGEIRVDSQTGRGSVFEFELPFEVSELRHLPTSTRQATPLPLRLLITDDDPNDRQILERIGSAFGWLIETTDNGQDAIALIAARQAARQPIDCLLLDWRMPARDGLDTLSELKQRIGEPNMPTVIMVTAEDRATLEKNLGEARPDSILTKPINPSALFNAVNEAVIAHGYDLSHVLIQGMAHRTPGELLKGMTVLAVDDSTMNLDVIQRLLRSEGASVLLADSGAAALAVLASVKAQGSRLDIVLMDMQMPDMDGCETTAQIRQQADFDRTPIIALTAGATTTEKERALAAGMNDFLTKPVDPLSLMRVLRSHIEPANAPPPPPSAVEEGPKDAGWPAQPGIDGAFAAEMMGGDVAFFREMLQQFLNENREAMVAIRRMLEAGDRQQAVFLAHRIKGQAGNLGAKALQKTAGEFEEALLEERGDIDALMQSFEQAHRQLFQ